MDETSRRLLLVDDEPDSLKLLEAMLAEADFHHITKAVSGQAAWEHLCAHEGEVDIVLIDRYMPEMDGLALLRRMKQHPSFCTIPVIVQTAETSAIERQNCLRAGAYYYLTKPYEMEVLLTTLSAANRDLLFHQKIKGDLQQFRHSLHLLKDSHFAIQTLPDATYLSSFLANFFPDPERVVIGLSELMINAIEHGNLGIGYMAKTELMYEGRWQEEIEHLLGLPEHANKHVDVYCRRREHILEVDICDQGQGFDWQRYMQIDESRATHLHGRGIAIANTISFDQLRYMGSGNRVCASAVIAQQAQVVAA